MSVHRVPTAKNLVGVLKPNVSTCCKDCGKGLNNFHHVYIGMRNARVIVNHDYRNLKRSQHDSKTRKGIGLTYYLYPCVPRYF